MPIIATAKGTYTPAPEGVWQAVCVDVVDLGVLYSEKFQTSAHKIDIVFQINKHNSDTNKRFLIRSRYTLSLSEKANLRSFLEAWRGKKFSKEDLVGFDVEKLIGINANLNIVHNGDWANVASIMPLTQGQPKLAPEKYDRVSPALPDHAGMPSKQAQIEEPEGEDIPF